VSFPLRSACDEKMMGDGLRELECDAGHERSQRCEGEFVPEEEC
jgi:hypothetical protein